MIKAIFCQCSTKIWPEVAERLSKKIGLEPCYWIGADYMEKLVKNKFPNIIFHDSIQAAHGFAATDCKKLSLPPISQPLLEKLSYCEKIAIQMMGRMDSDNSFTYEQRVHLYHNYVRYWTGILNHFKPDIVIFPIEPHVAYDYVLYEICKNKGIKTIMFQETSLVPLVFLTEQFELGSDEIRKMYNKIKRSSKTRDVKLSDDVEKNLKKLSGNYIDAVSSYAFGQAFQLKNRKQKHIPILSTMMHRINKILNNPRCFVDQIQRGIKEFAKGPYTYDKYKGKKFEDVHWSHLKYILYRNRSKRKMVQLKRYYDKLTQDVDFSRPYIYVALHYQPESSTSPLGGVFVDQSLVVDMLSKCVPDGWSIYVKEHWGQWRVGAYGDRARTTDFYDELASLPNVKMIPASIPSFDLVDNSKAVATITGTTGWEAVVRGKPALVFGHAWYKDCEGVFRTTDETSCRAALSKIEAGYKINKKSVRLFIYTLEKVCVRAYLQTVYENKAGIPHEENVSVVTQTIQSFLQKKGLLKNA